MKNKVSAILLVLLLAISSFFSMACNPKQDIDKPKIPQTVGTSGLEYILSDDGKYAICTGIGSATDTEITISSHYNGVVVKEIKSSAFNGQTSIVSLTIPEGVEKIGQKAFRNCKNLGSLTLPSTLKQIDADAFYLCKKLYAVNNHSNLEINRWESSNGFVGYYACNIYNSQTEIKGNTQTDGDYLIYTFGNESYIVEYTGSDAKPVIPDFVTGINCFAFYQNTYLSELSIPSNVKAIGAYAFWGNTSLKTITFEENCSLEIIGSIAFENCPIETFNFNDDINTWLNISFESKEANPLFFVKNLELKIGDIENIIVNKNVTSIKKNAFYNCTNIKNITLSESVETIDNYAFFNSSLENITFNKNGNLRKIGVKSFSREVETNYFDGKSNLNEGTAGPTIKSVNLPASLEVIDVEAFMNCEQLESVNIDDDNKLTTIGDYAFCSCEGLKTFIIGDNSELTTIRSYSLQSCRKLNTFLLGRNSKLNSIGSMTFQYANALQKVFIPKTVETIGNYCFGGIGDRDPNGGRTTVLCIEADKDGLFWGGHFNSSLAKTEYNVTYEQFLLK